MAKYKMARIQRSGGQVSLAAQGEQAAWEEADTIYENNLFDPEYAVFERKGGRWAPASHWLRLSTEPEAFIDELFASERGRAKEHRLKREKLARAAALAEAQQLRATAKANEEAARDAEKRAAELEVANT